MKVLLSITTLLLISQAADAQASLSAGRANVYAIKEPSRFSQFVVPQVRLLNAVAAARINRQLLQQVIGGNADGEISHAANPRAQLRQAATLECCFSGARYKVLLNQDNLLSLEFVLEFHGAYYYERTDHAVFDLRTGQRLTLADLLADPAAQMRRRLSAAINRRIGEFLADTATYDTATIANLAERFHWNAATRRVDFQTDAAPETEQPALNDFALITGTLLLFYRVDLPYSQSSLTPDDTYRFPYTRLQPTGLLMPLAKAAPLKK